MYFLFQEPHTNGPLFTELAFYQRVAKPDLSMLTNYFTYCSGLFSFPHFVKEFFFFVERAGNLLHRKLCYVARLQMIDILTARDYH